MSQTTATITLADWAWHEEQYANGTWYVVAWHNHTPTGEVQYATHAHADVQDAYRELYRLMDRDFHFRGRIAVERHGSRLTADGLLPFSLSNS